MLLPITIALFPPQFNYGMIFMHDWNIKYSSSLSVFKSELKKTLTKSLQILITFLKTFFNWWNSLFIQFILFILWVWRKLCIFSLQCLRYIQQTDDLSKQLNDINVTFQINCILYGSPVFSLYFFLLFCFIRASTRFWLSKYALF